jgi:uncharacterized protein
VKIAIDDIGPEGLDLQEPVTHQWLTELLGTSSCYRATQDGELQVHLKRADDVVYVRGQARLALEADCSRCLKLVPVSLNAPLQLTLVPGALEPKASAEGEVTEEDVGISVYQDREIDLRHLVRDEVFLEMPMQVLCTPACAGLCTTCGADQNAGACSCAPPIDIRLSALRRIKLP